MHIILIGQLKVSISHRDLQVDTAKGKKWRIVQQQLGKKKMVAKLSAWKESCWKGWVAEVCSLQSISTVASTWDLTHRTDISGYGYLAIILNQLEAYFDDLYAL